MVATSAISIVNINSSLFDNAQNAFDNAQNAIEEEQNLMQNAEKEAFNMQFSVYGGLQKGANIKALISAIESSNLNNPDHIIEYDNLNIDSSKQYQVSFEEDEDGYINLVSIIEE